MKKDIIVKAESPSDKAAKIFARKTKSEKIEILWEALDYMNQFNGRTKWECVALALGIRLT